MRASPETASYARSRAAQWRDPYTGVAISDASLIDIDHMVPLKNAHESGAWAWSKEKKKAYANDLNVRFHLLAVSRSENRRKSDRGPEEYLPPDVRYRCEYVLNWMAVKRTWGLRVTPEEHAAVDAIMTQCDFAEEQPHE